MKIRQLLRDKLFRPKSDGLTPFILHQRRVFILPTRAGITFALLLIVMLTGSINYSLSLGHALVFGLAGIGLTGMIHTFRNLHGLEVAPGRCEPVFAGEIAIFPLLFSNRRKLPRPALEIEAVPGYPVDFAVDGANTGKTGVPVPALQRGWLALPTVRLTTRYPLGLFRAWSYLYPEMRCLVYPQPIEAPLPAESDSSHGGEHTGDGGQDDFAGFREHQPADSPRHVAWKLQARQTGEQALQVKLFSGGAFSELQLDWHATDSDSDPETRIGILTGWVMQAEREGLHYGLQIPGMQIQVSHGDAHRQRCLEALALCQP